MKKEYYLCSEEVIKHFPDVEKSKPFKSGYAFDKHMNHYIAVLDFNAVENKYKELTEPIEFWCKECTPGSMDVSRITLSGAKKHGLFVEIESQIGLTTERNIAMTIYNLSYSKGITPIELIDKII